MSTLDASSRQRILDVLGYTLYAPAQAALPSVAAVPGIDANDRLVLAVLRAAGVEASMLDDVTGWWLLQGWVAPARLRSDPAAKRALWPHLRAMRKTRT